MNTEILVPVDVPADISDKSARDTNVAIIAEHILNGHIVPDAYGEISYGQAEVIDELDRINPAILQRIACFTAVGKETEWAKPAIRAAAKKIAGEVVDSYIWKADDDQDDERPYDVPHFLRHQAS